MFKGNVEQAFGSITKGKEHWDFPSNYKINRRKEKPHSRLLIENQEKANNRRCFRQVNSEEKKSKIGDDWKLVPLMQAHWNNTNRRHVIEMKMWMKGEKILIAIA